MVCKRVAWRCVVSGNVLMMLVAVAVCLYFAGGELFGALDYELTLNDCRGYVASERFESMQSCMDTLYVRD